MLILVIFLTDTCITFFPGGFCVCGRRLQQPGAVRRGQRTTTGTVQAKVLLAWRKATSCVKPSPAVSMAPSRMDKVRQRWTFRTWWERSRAVVEERTKRHHHHSSLQYVQIGDYVPAASAEL